VNRDDEADIVEAELAGLQDTTETEAEAEAIEDDSEEVADEDSEGGRIHESEDSTQNASVECSERSAGLLQ
jgi:hypothetical protein